MGQKQPDFNDKFEEYMQNFYCRLLRHDFVVSYVNDFFNKNEMTYYSFFMLMKVLGAHKDLKFQTNYWSDCYIYFYEKLGIHGILFIPLLLCKGSTDDKKKIIKKYLNEHINNTTERITASSNLVINLLEFKKVILTYVSCISTRGLENVIKAMHNDPEDSLCLQRPEIREQIKTFRILFSNQLVESFIDVLLRPYSRQNYYVNAGKFIDDNIDFLTDDKKIRERLAEYSSKQNEISKQLKQTRSLDLYSNVREQNENNKNEAMDDSNLLYNNNITKINDNSKINTNRPLINSNDNNQTSKTKDKKQFPINSEIGNLNEPEKSNESRREMIEYPKNSIIKEKLKGANNEKNNNSINISFKSGDWDVRNENSINQIDIKSKKSNSSQNKPSDEPKNITMSDFEESFREENIPKKI